MTPWLLTLMSRELATLQRELALFPSPELLWKAPAGFTNPAGTLILHVCGNLRHFVGAVLGGVGYLRDREREFTVREIPMEALEAELRITLDVVGTVLSAIPEDQLLASFPVEVAGVRPSTGLFLLHLEAHLAFHVGQVGVLRRVLSGEATSTHPMALEPLG